MVFYFSIYYKISTITLAPSYKNKYKEIQFILVFAYNENLHMEKPIRFAVYRSVWSRFFF